MPTQVILLALLGCPWISGSEHGDRLNDLDQDGFPASADCDDVDPTVNPDAEEICDDGVDQDCDGGPGPCAIGDVRIDRADRLVLGNGAFGTTIAWGDLAGDGGYEVAIGTSIDEADRGAVLFARSEDVLASEDVVPIATVSGASGDCMGRAVSFVPNLAGSGADQVVIGSPCTDFQRGTVLVGSWNGTGVDTVAASSSFETTTGMGRQVLGFPDGTGDGLPDVAVTTDDLVAVVSGTSWSPTSARVISSLTEAGGSFGDALAAGDMDGDGLTDLVLGAPLQASTGAVYVVTGLDDAKPRTLNVLQDAIVGEVESGFGFALAVCDLNGDGAADLAASAPAVGDQHGAVLVFYGPDFDARSYEGADLVIASDRAGGYFGYSLDCGGDVDGDGIADLLVGAPTYDTNGAAFLFSIAGATGDWAPSEATARVSGESNSDYAGIDVVVAPDLDGDGYDEIVVGAPGLRGGGGVAVLFGTGL